MNLENNKTGHNLNDAFDNVKFQNTTVQFGTTDDINKGFGDGLDHDPVQESYRQSEKNAQLHFWQILYTRFCGKYWGTSNINVDYVSYNNNPDWQKRGIDRIITFANGRCLHMEEKYVKGDHDKMFVEVFDNSDIRNNNRGWFYTLDPLNTHYIVYGYELTKKFYFIPLKAFQDVFSPIFQGLHFYKVDNRVRATGNRTKGILVPWNDIKSKIKGFVYMQL